jgi:hypothetical protein
MRNIGITGVVSTISLLSSEESAKIKKYVALESAVLITLQERFEATGKEAQKAIDHAVTTGVVERRNNKLWFSERVDK